MNKHNLGLAAVLSFFLPGLGQLYKGQILKGLALMLITNILYFSVVGIPLALILHLFAIYNAYNQQIQS